MEPQERTGLTRRALLARSIAYGATMVVGAGFVAQNGAALVVFPIIGVAVLVAGIVMIVTGVRNRRAWDRAHRPAWRA